MQINIGTVIPLKGKRFYCSEININKSIGVARDWDVSNWSGKSCQSTERITFISQETAVFKEGDVYSIESERLFMREVDGCDFHTIYTYHKVRKETDLNGSQGTESSDGEASSGEAQSSGEGGEDRVGAGGSSVSEADPALHRD